MTRRSLGGTPFAGEPDGSATFANLPEAGPSRRTTTMTTDALPFPLPAPDSLRASDAAAWYYATVPLIAGLLDNAPSSQSKLDFAWSLTSRLRLAAALSLFDQELVQDFFTVFSLPSMAELSGVAHYDAIRYAEGWEELPEHVPDDEAVARLLALVASQNNAFDHTFGNEVGLEISDGRQDWMLTSEGWQPKA